MPDRWLYFWSQFAAAKQAGAAMVYQAMFDEVDEGTAIYKCTNDVPVGASQFLTYESLPSDHYLKLVNAASKMIRGETPVRAEMPASLMPKRCFPLRLENSWPVLSRTRLFKGRITTNLSRRGRWRRPRIGC